MRTATWLDIPGVRALLARAYVTDPLMMWIFPDEATRLESVAAWLGLFAEPAVAAAAVDVLDPHDGAGDVRARLAFSPATEPGGVSAVAVWRFPHDPSASPSSLPTVAGLLTALIGTERACTVGVGLARLRPLAPPAPSAYVQFLAVDPTCQRRGLGRTVLQLGLRRAAAEGVGVHLETANPAALPFYEALGFTVSGTIDLPGGGPRLWALTSPAPSPAGAAPAPPSR